jgi:drug/metabolite transporter (DMT)-like permease
MRAGSIALLTYAVPVVAVAVGTLFLAEPFTLRMALGSAVVLSGVALAVSRRPGSKASTG